MAGNCKGKIVFVVMILAGICAPVIAQTHSADVNGDSAISLSELLRVIQFYNSEGFHCEAGTEDGYAPGTGEQTCDLHDSDYIPQDWHINLSELLRIIQFFNFGGYHIEEDTEDGYAPNIPIEEGEGGAEGEGDVEGVEEGSEEGAIEGMVEGEGGVEGQPEGEICIEGECEETILLPGGVPVEMVWIPGGSFMMGRYSDEQDSYFWEDPQHPVTIPGFWMGKYELTKAQWTAVMGTIPWSGYDDVLDDPNSPAEYVSWNNAQSFLTAMNTCTGLTFRLPSESEWEYACRAGTTTRFYWGDDPGYTIGNDYCWWYYNAYNVDERYAHIVGLKLPNLFGLFDMSGNAWEWCEDDWHSNYTGGPTDGTSWVDSPRGSYRMFRGGGAANADDAGSCRSAGRGGMDTSGAGSSLGFRLAR